MVKKSLFTFVTFQSCDIISLVKQVDLLVQCVIKGHRALKRDSLYYHIETRRRRKKVELRKLRLIRSPPSNRVGLLVQCDLKVTSLFKGGWPLSHWKLEEEEEEEKKIR
jgi:hypothetical protein